MRYVGGKSKIAKAIAQAILSRTDQRAAYYEPFVGGGAVFAHMAPHFERAEASDLSPDLMLMWSALHSGWAPPPGVTPEEYRALKGACPSPLRGLVGFGGSFGGKWFGGYAKGGFGSDGQPRNHQRESADNALAIVRAVGPRASFHERSYLDINPAPGSVVYADPPYAGTEGYAAAGSFDHGRFWDTMRSWCAHGCHVFVSEYQAPPDWDCVWEQEHRRSLSLTKQGRPTTTERLFTPSPKPPEQP